MKALNQFTYFDFAGFCKDKKFLTTDVRPWVNPENKRVLGTVVEVVIVEDHTVYQPTKDGRAISNMFEKMNWKIARNIDIPIGAQVVAVDGVGTVYGDFRNQLSAVVADVKVVSPSAPVNGGKAPASVNPGKALS